jgi:hypothetical protein
VAEAGQRERDEADKLVDYVEKHLFDEVTFDYFALSLPAFLVFEEVLQLKHSYHGQESIRNGANLRGRRA